MRCTAFQEMEKIVGVKKLNQAAKQCTERDSETLKKDW